MVELRQSASLSIAPATATVAAGSQVALSVTLRNTGAAADRYTLAVEGIPADWCSVDTLSVPLGAGDARHIPLIIHPPAIVQPAAEIPVMVQAVSHSSRAVHATALLPLTVKPSDSLGMDVTPVDAEGRAATFHVTLRNGSAVEETLTLHASDAEGRLHFRIEPDPTVMVPAHAAVTVRVRAGPPGGKRHTYAVDVRATNRDLPDDGNLALVRRLRFTYAPLALSLPARPWRGGPRRLPIPTSAAMFVVLLALVALAFVYALTVPEPVGHRTATGSPRSLLPYIQQFQERYDPDARAIRLIWRVTAADAVTLNGQPVAASGAQSLTAADTNATYELQATNRQGTVTSQLAATGPGSPGAPAGPSASQGPVLSIAPSGGAGRAGGGRTVRPGDTVVIAGRGYARGEPIALALNGRALAAGASAVSADATGRFIARVALPPELRAGANTLSALGATSQGAAVGPLVGYTPLASRFYFAGGQNSRGTHPTLLLLNAGTVRADAALTAYFDDGATATRQVGVAARTQQQVALVGLVGRHASFGLAVSSGSPALSGLLALTRFGRDDDAIPAVAAPATTWYLAEGYSLLTFYETLSILNPDPARAAHVTLRLVGRSVHGNHAIGVMVPPHSSFLVDVNRLLRHRAAGSVSIVVSADHGIVIERSLAFGRLVPRGRSGYGLTMTDGTSAAATSWLFPGGAPGSHTESYLAALNPGSRPAHLTLRFYGTAGRMLENRPLTLMGGDRTDVRLDGRENAVGTTSIVTSDQPVAVERSDYTGPPNGVGIAGAATFGLNGPAAQWSFAGGGTSGTRETLTLYNPLSTTAAITATFYDAAGRAATRSLSLPSHTLASLDVARLVPGLGPLHGVTLQAAAGQGVVASQTVASPDLRTLRSVP